MAAATGGRQFHQQPRGLPDRHPGERDSDRNRHLSRSQRYSGNRIDVRAVDPNHAFVNDDHRNLLRLDEVTGGGMVLVKSLGEILAERGKRLGEAVSSGSTGSALLLNPRAPKGVGVLVNRLLGAGRARGVPVRGQRNRAQALRRRAVPGRAGERSERPARRLYVRAHSASEDARKRADDTRPEPGSSARGGATASDDAAVAWTQGVLRDYVLPELKPDVVINWLTEPDHIQHGVGAGSPQARASIRADDVEVGRLLEKLSALGLAGSTNIIVVSDHGFSHGVFGVNLTAELIKAGLKASADSDDVVIASSGQTMLLHVKDRDSARIQRLTEFLMAQEWIGVLFTAGRPNDNRPMIDGVVPGTLALDLIHLAPSERSPDIVVTFPWSSASSPFGVPGTDYTESGRATGPLTGTQGNHGSMSPWTIRNTFIAWGTDFKRGTTVRTPVSNVDLTPTLLALMGLDGDPALPHFDGRAIAEAFVDGPDPEQVPVRTTTHVTATPDGAYRVAIQITEVGDHRYIDKSWRMR